MDRDRALSVLHALHDAQNAMYSGDTMDAVRTLLTEEIEWHVPGENGIAGDYRGIDEVVEYFGKRRGFASNTLRLHPGEVLVGDTHVAVLTDGTARFDGMEHRWSTVGLYRLQDERIAACWLLPLDQRAFDRAWATQPPTATA